MSSIVMARHDAPHPGAPRLVPPRITPPARQLNRLAFMARFLRNPLSVVPQAAYEEDFVPLAGGNPPMVWVTEPGLIKTVLLEQRDKFDKRVQVRILGPLLGKGILTSEGADWKWQRQTCAPMFRHSDLMSFVPTFVRATERLIDRWRYAPAGSVQDIDRDMTQATFDVISATLLPSADGTVGEVVEASTRQFQRSGAWHLLYTITNAPKWLPQPGRWSMQSSIRSLRGATAGLLAERRNGTPSDDLMHRLMQARDPETGAPMNDEQLIDNLLTFYLAGHETTARALTWTLYLLARSPEWTRRVVDEIARVAGGAAIAAEHVDKLPLTVQVIKESMRVCPPVPLMSRQAIAETKLGPYTLAAGTSVVMPIYAIHRHRRRWQDPDAFDPTRFAPENEAKMSRYQYMPFGAGPRTCIGMAFAMIEATAMLATLLQRARFAVVDGHEPVPVARVTLVPKGGLPLKVWVD